MESSTLERPLSADGVEKRPRILIVEDEQVVADVLSFWLGRQGFETLWADNGEAGLQMARTERPELVVLDIRLPDIDGLAVCEALADSSQTCDIPVIVLSGLEHPDIIRRARGAGCRFFVHKPCDPNALLVLIRQAIEDAREWRLEEPQRESDLDPFEGWLPTEFDEPV